MEYGEEKSKIGESRRVIKIGKMEKCFDTLNRIDSIKAKIAKHQANIRVVGCVDYHGRENHHWWVGGWWVCT